VDNGVVYKSSFEKIIPISPETQVRNIQYDSNTGTILFEQSPYQDLNSWILHWVPIGLCGVIVLVFFFLWLKIAGENRDALSRIEVLKQKLSDSRSECVTLSMELRGLKNVSS
jgi:hypothetical protein